MNILKNCKLFQKIQTLKNAYFYTLLKMHTFPKQINTLPKKCILLKKQTPPKIHTLENAYSSKSKTMHTLPNIPRIGKLPYGAKRGFIERKASLKERLYWTNCEIWSKFRNLVKLWNLVKVMKFDPNSEIWPKFWNLVKILK